jgi:hypothetical protein
MDRDKLNTIVNDILLPVKPVKLRKTIAEKFLAFYEAEKHRADIADEALILACGDLSSYYYMTGAEALAENYIHQATERLKEKTK